MSNDNTFDTVTALVDAGYKNNTPKTYIVEEMGAYVPPQLDAEVHPFTRALAASMELPVHMLTKGPFDLNFVFATGDKEPLNASAKDRRFSSTLQPYQRDFMSLLDKYSDKDIKLATIDLPCRRKSMTGHFPRASMSEVINDSSYPPVKSVKTVRDLLNEKRANQAQQLGVCVQQAARTVWSNSAAFECVMKYRATLHSMGNTNPVTVYQTDKGELRLDRADKLCKLGGLKGVVHMGELVGLEVKVLVYWFNNRPAAFDRLLLGTIVLHKGWSL